MRQSRRRNSLHGWVRGEAQDGRQAVGLTALTVTAVIPLTFALFDEDRLRMSDDYAAITASVSLAILLIGVVDLHFNVSKARELVAAGPVTETARTWRTRRNPGGKTRQDLIKAHISTMRQWLTTSALLTVSLVLMALWAAIEDHGPARWLAWYSLLAASWGLATVLLACVEKLQEPLYDLFDLLRPPLKNLRLTHPPTLRRMARTT